jgi:sarcosine oxidase gamma subunit
VECQAVTLSMYRVELQEDRKHLKSVGHPRLAETVFRSPQLTLFDLGPDEWMLYWKGEPYARRARKRVMSGVMQPALFDLVELEPAVDVEVAQTLHPWLRVVPKESPTETEE